MRVDRWIWDRRYCEEADLLKGPPVPLLPTWLSRLPRGRALDLAAGCGRNALYLARQGYRVDAIDISIVGLDRLVQQARAHGVSIRAVVADLDELPLPEATYDLIVMTYYLNRQLFPQLPRALVPGGALVVETPMYDPRADPPEEIHPHRLRPGELFEAFSSLDIVHYEERLPVPPRMRGICQVIAFRRRCLAEPAGPGGRSDGHAGAGPSRRPRAGTRVSCQQVRETLWQYIDQELDREAAGRIENHIRGCRDCSARVAFERQLRVLLRRAWDAQAPPELWARVRRLLRML